VNLTDRQKQLLRVLVVNHHGSGGKKFYFTRGLTISGVSYPGNIPSSIPCDDVDLDVLRRERLIELVLVSKGLALGTPTQLGIGTVGAEQSDPHSTGSAKIDIPAQGKDSSEPESVQPPDLEGRYPKDAKSEAMTEVECARSQWEFMVAAGRKLATCTLVETIDIEQERDQRLSNTISHLEVAISVLFDGLAQAYWNLVRPDVKGFFQIVPAIAKEVEESIVFPGLDSLVRELISGREEQWRERIAQLGIITNNAQWSGFRTTFNDLVRRENQLFGQVTYDHLLGASGIYENTRHECGDWSLRGSKESLREEFRLCATRAGIALGVPVGVQPLEFWLHRLFWYLLDSEKTDYLFAAKEGGGVIRRLLEASEFYCTFLERVAIENDYPRSANRPDGPSDPEHRMQPANRSMNNSDVGWAEYDESGNPRKVQHFPNRAAWVRAKLSERGWNKHDLQGHGGPEHRTTQKILDGLKVQEGVLRKVITGLQSKLIYKGRKLQAVSDSDLPNS
jgi:hypothetical protein